MKNVFRATLTAVLLVALPACDDTPATPNPPPPPPLGPAQLSFSVQFVQATASAAGVDDVAFQHRRLEGNLLIEAAPDTMPGTLISYEVTVELGQTGIVWFTETVTPPGGISVPAGGTTTVPFGFDFSIDDDPFFNPSNNPPLLGGWTAGWDDGSGIPQTTQFQTSVSSGVTRYAAPGCVEDANTLCLLADGRFEVAIDWRDATGASGPGTVIGRFPPNGGHFAFADPAELALFVDVFDGCADNGAFLVFFTGLVTDEFTLTVTDTATNTVKEYRHPLGNPPPAIVDTSAFATCPAPMPVP